VQLAQVAADLERLVCRLRSLSSHSWRRREDSVRGLAQHLADLAATADGLPIRAVPALPAHGLADVIAVLGGDVVASLSDCEGGKMLGMAAEVVAAGLRDTA